LRPELALTLIWLAWVVSWVAAASWAAKTVERPRGQTAYRILTTLGLVLLFFFWRVPRVWRFDNGWQWALAGVAALGFVLCWWARLHMGKLWSASITFKEDHRVVDNGPYALVRHPIYTGISLAAFATALQEGSLIALAGAAILTWGWYVKARIEEDFLRTELGAQAYDAYAARVPMLVPFLKF
jgi:protein-S-isoprenylcysteine O-methyltransferase Ste14